MRDLLILDESLVGDIKKTMFTHRDQGPNHKQYNTIKGNKEENFRNFKNSIRRTTYKYNTK